LLQLLVHGLLVLQLLLHGLVQLLVWGHWGPRATRSTEGCWHPGQGIQGGWHGHGGPQAWQAPTMQLLHLDPIWPTLDDHQTLTLLLTWLEGVMLLLLLPGSSHDWLRGQAFTAAGLSGRNLIRHGAQLLAWQQHHPHELIPPAKLCSSDAGPGGNHHPTPLILAQATTLCCYSWCSCCLCWCSCCCWPGSCCCCICRPECWMHCWRDLHPLPLQQGPVHPLTPQQLQEGKLRGEGGQVTQWEA
jgi:hypothetical protein